MSESVFCTHAEKTWSAVRIKTALKNEINKIIATEKNPYIGITNSSQFIDLLIREKLKDLEAKP